MRPVSYVPSNHYGLQSHCRDHRLEVKNQIYSSNVINTELTRPQAFDILQSRTSPQLHDISYPPPLVHIGTAGKHQAAPVTTVHVQLTTSLCKDYS